jgi:quinol monooxygenase YgiN
MGQAHTHGTWRVKKGREDEFVAAWHELASWTNDDFGEVGGGRLLQDDNDPTLFYSVGSWPSDEAIEAWRTHPEFARRLEAIDELIDSRHIETLKLRAEVGDFCSVPA